MAKVPKKTTIYTRGPKYTEGQEVPDELLPKKAPEKPKPKKGQDKDK
jgi:hypothetical protein